MDHTVLGGIAWRPADRFELGFDAVLSEGDASLDPFDFDLPEGYSNPNQSYDFTQTHLQSDLDFTRIELGVRLSYQASEMLSVYGGYRYLDYEDDAPYLYDTSGEVSFYSAGVAWTF